MSDSFCTPYKNPRTGNVTTGGAARNGRIKTLGGMDEITKKVQDNVMKELLIEADKPNHSKKKGNQ